MNQVLDAFASFPSLKFLQPGYPSTMTSGEGGCWDLVVGHLWKEMFVEIPDEPLLKGVIVGGRPQD